MLIKRCVICDKEFVASTPRNIMCSDECKRARQLETNKKWAKKNQSKSKSKTLVNLGGVKTQFHTGDKVTVYQDFDGNKSEKYRKALIIKCYKYFALCKLKHYKETFTYDKINPRREP